MTKRKIFFRADAGAQIGYGHFIRTLALADMLRDDFDCTFLTQSPSEYQQKEVEKVCPLVALPSDDSKFEKFIDCLKGEEIIVLDNYFYTSEYQKQIKEKGCKLVCIDDMHDKHYYADVVINHGLTDENLFDVEPYTRLCLGFDYALLRRPFIQVSNTVKLPNSWFISFGGTDFLNLTEKILKAIHDDPRVDSITVVIGDAYKYIENLKNYPKATIEKNLTAEEMAEDLTDYMKELGIRVKYLHSDIDTLERAEIIRDLRLDVFDVLVGINLLREGLDIPEITLVAILDADKEGFLRSETSLIQTIGRAARNSEGHVIMYADKITDSMRKAIDETERRRRIQQEYNEEHNITPTTIQKSVRDLISVSKKVAQEELNFKKDPESMNKEELTKLIADIQKKMQRAAADLNFEAAAEYRDQMLQLKTMLQDL